MKTFPYTALPDLTPSEQATFTSIVDRLRARRYEIARLAEPWTRPEHSERLRPVARRSGTIARVLQIARVK